MHVECLMNRARDRTLADEKQVVLAQIFPSEATEVHLTRGRKYLVYAIRGSADGNLLYIADDAYSGLPVPYPDFFFRVADSRLSAHWKATKARYEELGDLTDGAWLACQPWRIKGDSFYENLAEGVPHEMRSFCEMADLLKQEFSDCPVRTAHCENPETF